VQFQFPGNVRQLENICHWLTVMAPAQVIELKDLPPEVLAGGMSAATTPESSAAPGLPAAADWTGTVSGSATAVSPMVGVAAPVSGGGWESGLEEDALALLHAGRTDVWDVLTRRFETSLIQAALSTTRGRRIEAAQKLGIGRNTITRKIQELGIDE